MSTSGAVVYRRLVVPRWVFWALLMALVGLGAWAQWRDPGEGGHGGAGSFAFGALIYALVWGIPIWVALITVWSINLYGNIVLDHEVLRIGRERIHVRDIDRGSVVRLTTDHGPAGRRARRAKAEPEPEPRARPAGGAYALPMGLGSVDVALRDGRQVVLQTRDRARLVEALLSVVPAAADAPETPVLSDDRARTRTVHRRAPWGPAVLRDAAGLTSVHLPQAPAIALSGRRTGGGEAGTGLAVLVDGRHAGQVAAGSLATGSLEVQVDHPSLAAPGLRLGRHSLSLGLILRDDEGALVRPPTVRSLLIEYLLVTRFVRPVVADRARPEHVALWLAASWHLGDGH